MSPDNDTPDDALADALAAYDEALAAGMTPGPKPSAAGAIGPGDAELLREHRRVLALLHRLWPHDGRSAGAPDPAGLGSGVARALAPGAPAGIAGVCEAAGGDLGTLPRAFGRYQILRRLGAGGMGTVYLAHDTTLDRPVALKVSRFQPDESPQAMERFLREARAAARIQHEAVCPVFDYGAIDGIPYLTMACIAGKPLGDVLRADRPPEPRWAVQLVHRAALGLDAAHREGVLHRDLKPNNIVLDEHDRPRVVDFGLAWRAQDPSLTDAGVTPGTPAYMSPEQVKGEPLGTATDIYSLGVVLYELLTGRLPFAGVDRSQLAYQIVHSPPAPPSRLRPELDPPLDPICLTALAKAPGDRYGTMGQMADALQAYLSGSSGVVQPPGDATGRPAGQPARQAEETRLGTMRSALAAHRRMLVIALLALAGALGAWYVVARPRGDESRALGTGAEAKAALKGWIDVTVWDPHNEGRRRLSLKDAEALPLKAGDRIRIDAALNARAYPYVIWIDAEGKAAPVYPWQPGHWEKRPAEEQLADRLSLPEKAKQTWGIKRGAAGMETLVLLAREDVLPSDVDLPKVLAGLPSQRMQNPRAAVWFENGDVVLDEPTRAPDFFNVEVIDDPVLATQHLLKERLGPYFSYTRAVSFASLGK
jgi:hypothetical protein